MERHPEQSRKRYVFEGALIPPDLEVVAVDLNPSVLHESKTLFAISSSQLAGIRSIAHSASGNTYLPSRQNPHLSHRMTGVEFMRRMTLVRDSSQPASGVGAVSERRVTLHLCPPVAPTLAICGRGLGDPCHILRQDRAGFRWQTRPKLGLNSIWFVMTQRTSQAGL